MEGTQLVEFAPPELVPDYLALFGSAGRDVLDPVLTFGGDDASRTDVTAAAGGVMVLAMPTSRTFTFDYPADLESVAALLHDPDFLRKRCEAAGDRNVEINIQAIQDGVHMTVARERTMELPAIVKSIVSPTNRAVETTTWRRHDGAWQADYSLEVAGLPGKVSGHSELRSSPSGTHYTSTFEVTAKWPLIAKRIETAIADGFTEQLAINAERNAEALKGET
jgi:hypothetical protein